MALGMLAYAGAIILAIGAAFYWLSDTHRTSRFHVDRVSARVSERLTMPVAIPVLAAGTLALFSISVSRILLASTKSAAVAVAGVVSIIFLLGGILAAARPRSTRQQFVAVAVVAILSVVGLGVAGVIKGEAPLKHHGDSKEHGADASHGAEGTGAAEAGAAEGDGHSSTDTTAAP